MYCSWVRNLLSVVQQTVHAEESQVASENGMPAAVLLNDLENDASVVRAGRMLALSPWKVMCESCC